MTALKLEEVADTYAIFDQMVSSPGQWAAEVRVLPWNYRDDIRYAVLVNAEGWGVAFQPDGARELGTVLHKAADLAKRPVPEHVKTELRARVAAERR